MMVDRFTGITIRGVDRLYLEIPYNNLGDAVNHIFPVNKKTLIRGESYSPKAWSSFFTRRLYSPSGLDPIARRWICAVG